MSGPFDRGWNRTDFYTAALVTAAHTYRNETAAFAALDAVEPGQHTSFSWGTIALGVLVSITQRFCFLSVQGTQNRFQWIFGNLLGSAQTAQPPIPGSVAMWFGVSALGAWIKIRDTVRPALPGRRLVLLGHSLGGAVVQELATLFSSESASGITCLSLGSPRVGDPIFAGAASPYTLRCENTEDCVPSLPPILWQGAGSHFPISGPGFPAIYLHAGAAKTLAADGTLTDGSSPPSILDAVDQLRKWDIPTHYPQVYAARLRLGLTAEDLSPRASGYANPSMLDGVAKVLGISVPGETPTFQGGSEMYRVTLFFNLGTRAGVSESFYTNTSLSTVTKVINDYLTNRMALATKEFAFQYARISNVPATRKVSWRSPGDFLNATTGNSTSGTITAAPEQALLLRLSSDSQDDFRIFLHGFPQIEFKGEKYSPFKDFSTAVQRFVATLSNGSYLFQTLAVPHTPALRTPITAVEPVSPRGCKITPGGAALVNVGDTVAIGGQGARFLGLNGRKKVIDVGPGGATFTIGGAEPVGNPTDLAAGAYFYIDSYEYETPSFGEVERLTTHKVGRPFGVRPGRQGNTIPLRQ